jgi:formylmethanofuran dehydrogenase subunit E
MNDLHTLLTTSAARHSHLCPRQVLGVRVGLAGIQALELEVPREDKRLLVIVETDGCFADGVEVATLATVGHRTLRIEDYGKIAATFVDASNGQAVRIAPRLNVRQQVWKYAQGEDRHYFAQLLAYQVMPEEELLSIQSVRLATPVEEIISHAGARARCDICGEDIINEREIQRNGMTLCHACAGQAYYVPTPKAQEIYPPIIINS